MRQDGSIINWDDEKGFGFIAPNNGTADVFLHFRAVADRARRPKVGDRVEYDLDHDVQQRPRAARALLRPSIAAPLSLPGAPHRLRTAFSSPRSRGIRRESGIARVILILLIPATALGAVCLGARRGFIPEWVAVLYVGMSAVTAVAYAVDKSRAQKGRWRIAEGTLQLFAMAGGWPGAFPAQRFLRHKTSKVPFQVTYWSIVTAHLAFWSWFTATQCGWLSR